MPDRHGPRQDHGGGEHPLLDDASRQLGQTGRLGRGLSCTLATGAPSDTLEASRKPGAAPESAHSKGNFSWRLPNIPLNRPSTLDGSRPDRRTAGGPRAGMAAARACRYGMRTAPAAAHTGRG